MKFGARKTDLLSPEEREIVERFERGAIDATEAGRLLIASAQPVSAATSPEDDEDDQAETEAETEDVEVDPNETPEEAAARRLVERIARDVYGAEGAATSD